MTFSWSDCLPFDDYHSFDGYQRPSYSSFQIRKKRAGNSYQAIMKGLNEDLLMFGDRPARSAFDYSVKRFIGDWDYYFENDNPNGVFTYSSPKKDVRISAELFNPKLSRNGKKLKFDMRFSKDQSKTNETINDSEDVLTGALSKGKEASLFLDNICSILPVCFRTRPDSGLQIYNNTGGRLMAQILSLHCISFEKFRLFL